MFVNRDSTQSLKLRICEILPTGSVVERFVENWNHRSATDSVLDPATVLLSADFDGAGSKAAQLLLLSPKPSCSPDPAPPTMA